MLVRPKNSSVARRAPRAFLLLITATMLIAGFLGLHMIWPHVALADAHPGGDVHNPAVLNVDIARPAVMRIEAYYTTSSLTLQLCSGVSETLDSGPVGSLGSGAFISAHGDILTAGHVVSPPKFDLEIFLIQNIAAQISQDIQTKCHQSLSPNQVVLFYENNPNLINATFPAIILKAWLDTSYVGSYSATTVRSAKSYPVTIKALSSFERNDVAIAHIDLEDTPSVTIGDSTAVSPTDHLTIIGYPGNGDANHSANVPLATDFLTASVNDTFVSAIKTNDNGGVLIQVGGNVEHGDSGGPALTAKGEVVGVVSFGGLDNPDGTSFLQATSSAKPLLTQSGVDMTAGKFQASWRQAMTDFAATTSNHWHTAQTELQALQSSYPLFVGVLPYMTYAQNQAQNETATGSSTTTTQKGPAGINLSDLSANSLIGIGLIALAGVLLLILIVSLIIRASRRSAPVAIAQAVRVPVGVAAGSSPNSGPNTNAYPPSMPNPPSDYGYQGYNSAPTGTPTGQRPAVSTPLTSAPPPPAQPNYWEQASSPQAAPPPPPQAASPSTQSNYCVNGHPMQAYEVYCTTCGAPRSQAQGQGQGQSQPQPYN